MTSTIPTRPSSEFRPSIRPNLIGGRQAESGHFDPDRARTVSDWFSPPWQVVA